MLVGLLLLPLPSKAAYSQDIAIIVSKENATEELSFKELVKIFKREKQYWSDGSKIYLIMRETGSPMRRLLLTRVYQMTDEELKSFWLVKIFRGQLSSLPKTFGSDDAVKRFVSQVPNAIGFIDSSSSDTSVKVLRIDGKRPGEGGYALAASQPHSHPAGSP